MTVYLAIITTALVLTQIIRLVQNTISLKRQEQSIKRELKWFSERDVTMEDFDCQREVMYLLRERLLGDAIRKESEECSK